MKKVYKNCKYCGNRFEVYPENPQKEYCTGSCWCLANGIDDKNCKHYLGGHKNIKRKKRNEK